MRKTILFLLPLLCILSLDAKSMKEYETLSSGEKVIARGTLFYSEPMKLYSEKDKVNHNVVLAAKIFIKTTPKGYAGYLVTGLYDLDEKKPIQYYNVDMQSPVNSKIGLKNIEIDGKTVRFRYKKYAYTVIDGGKGFMNDRVIVKDRDKTKYLKLFGGDFDVYTDSKEKK